MAVQDIDLGWNEIMRKTRALAATQITIGIHEDAPPEPDGTDLVMVAAVNEFGTDRAGPNHNTVIPSRPFMRTTADLYAVQLQQEVESEFDRMLGGGTARKMLSNIGLWYQGRMKATLMTGPWTRNAPRTVAKKGFDWPLVHTLTLWRNIVYKLVRV